MSAHVSNGSTKPERVHRRVRPAELPHVLPHPDLERLRRHRFQRSAPCRASAARAPHQLTRHVEERAPTLTPSTTKSKSSITRSVLPPARRSSQIASNARFSCANARPFTS